MRGPELSLRRLARGSGVLAFLAGGWGVLYMLGAFGPVSCWTSRSATGATAAGGATEASTTEVTRHCESGIDYLLGAGGGNAPVLFAWSAVLLVLVTVGVGAVWTDRRYVTWATVLVGAAITVIGVFSIGWYFLLPTVFLLVAAVALSWNARRDSGEAGPAAS